MDYQMHNGYQCCVVTPAQACSAGFVDQENRCVTVVPPQEGGYLMPDGYRFSDGYSMDYQHLANHVPVHGNFECNPHLYGETGHDMNMPPQYLYHQQGYYNVEKPQPYDSGEEVMGTETLPQFSGQSVPLTTEFFASNSAFKRIPMNPSRAIFRRRKQGDATNEWSNAFLNEESDPCEITPCCTG